MPIFYSSSCRGFFDPDVHGSLPDDALPINAKRHRELIAGQEQGARIEPGEDGRPRLAWPDRSIATRRARLVARIKREAGRRIEHISPRWRQLNDIRTPSEDGALRFARIDAVRAASTEIEAQVRCVAAADLEAFPVPDHPFWPEFGE